MTTFATLSRVDTAATCADASLPSAASFVATTRTVGLGACALGVASPAAAGMPAVIASPITATATDGIRTPRRIGAA